MYGEGGPPDHQGKAPAAVCALRSLASEASRSAFAMRGSSTFTSPDPASAPPLAASSHGVSSSTMRRVGSGAAQDSSGVSRFDIASAIFATAG